MTIIVFNKPLNEISAHEYLPYFSISVRVDVHRCEEFVEVMGTPVDRWHGLKIEMQHVAHIYEFSHVGGVRTFDNCLPKSNYTCS